MKLSRLLIIVLAASLMIGCSGKDNSQKTQNVPAVDSSENKNANSVDESSGSGDANSPAGAPSISDYLSNTYRVNMEMGLNEDTWNSLVSEYGAQAEFAKRLLEQLISSANELYKKFEYFNASFEEGENGTKLVLSNPDKNDTDKIECDLPITFDSLHLNRVLCTLPSSDGLHVYTTNLLLDITESTLSGRLDLLDHNRSVMFLDLTSYQDDQEVGSEDEASNDNGEQE